MKAPPAFGAVNYFKYVLDMVNDLCHHVSMNSKNDHSRDGLYHKGNESHLFREIVRTHQVLMSEFSRKVGMSGSRLALMRLLAIADEDVGVMDLARQLSINASAVTRQLKEMEKEGLIQRRGDPKDGRRSYVNLSASGLMLFNEIHARGHELECALSEVLNADEMATSVEVLSKLRKFLEGHSIKKETP